MNKLITLIIAALLPLSVLGAGGNVHLDHVDLDMEDNESLQRGAKYYTNYCMGCHSLSYSRYERVADDLGIPHDLMMENLVFSDAKIGQLMTIAMPEKKAAAWFGAAPPDLTLVARKRNPDWLYTYLRTFYRDDSRPWGVNNKTFPNVGMPHVLADLQGMQECAPGGDKVDQLTGDTIKDDACGSLEVKQKGSMSPDEYDQAIKDLVGFMTYVAEPMALERKSLGVKVLLFILFFSVFVFLLNREYWKDIH